MEDNKIIDGEIEVMESENKLLEAGKKAGKKVIELATSKPGMFIMGMAAGAGLNKLKSNFIGKGVCDAVTLLGMDVENDESEDNEDEE